MTYLYLAAKFWRECIIVILAILLLICLFIQNHQATEIKDQKQQHADYVAAQELIIAKAKANAATQEKAWAEKITMLKLNKLTLMLLMLSPALTACQSNSALQSSVCPQLPKKPQIGTQQNSQTYLNSASTNIEKWRSELMNTELMKKN